MTFDLIARVTLALEAVACLWLARLAWAEAPHEKLPLRMIGPALGFIAAALILYGLLNT